MGELGRKDDAEITMKQIDQLKKQKNELLIANELPLMTKKQRKPCETSGKMQSLQDNEKRLQTHT